MASARHSRGASARSRGPRGGVALGAALVGLGLAGGTILALQSNGNGTGGGGCSNRIVLDVVTSPELAGPLEKLAVAYGRQQPAVQGHCLTVDVSGRTTGGVADAFAAGTTDSGDGQTPDVWVPESTTWSALARNGKGAAGLVPASGPVIASSPTVIASPKPMATALGWPTTQLTWAQLATDGGSDSVWRAAGHPAWGGFQVGFATPDASIASSQALLGLAGASQHTALGKLAPTAFQTDRSVELRVLTLERGTTQVTGSTADLLAGLRKADRTGNGLGYVSAAPMQESDLIAYNRTHPKVPLVASYPKDGLYDQQVPYLVLQSAAADPVRAKAAAGFLAAVRAPAGQAALSAAGFRAPDGTATGFTTDLGVQPTLPATTSGTVSGAVLGAAHTFFDRIHQRGVTLAVLDTSGSMADPVPGTGKTKLDLAVNAALAGLQLFATNDQLGLWTFSTDQDGTKGYKQLSPIAQIDSKGAHGTHRQDLAAIAPTVVAKGDTALYDSALAAYQAMTKAYVPGRLNQVVLFTDGRDDTPRDPHSLTLSALLSKLKMMYDPSKPVRIITIGYGPDADPTALKQISDATHAKSYLSRDPKDINGVFFDALVQAGS